MMMSKRHYLSTTHRKVIPLLIYKQLTSIYWAETDNVSDTKLRQKNIIFFYIKFTLNIRKIAGNIRPFLVSENRYIIYKASIRPFLVSENRYIIYNASHSGYIE